MKSSVAGPTATGEARAGARIRLADFLPYRLARTANLLSQAVAETYGARFGLSGPEWRVLAHVAEGDSPSQAEVAASSRMDKVGVSRAVAALMRRGLLERRLKARDRRTYALGLTEVGLRLYLEIAPEALRVEEAIFAGFTPSRRRELIALLGEIDRAALARLAGGGGGREG